MIVSNQTLFSDAKLEAFGSSCNGFGFRESDLDLCLTFTRSDPMVNQSFANSCIPNHIAEIAIF